jgi:hypothetical protein
VFQTLGFEWEGHNGQRRSETAVALLVHHLKMITVAALITYRLEHDIASVAGGTEFSVQPQPGFQG